MTRMIHLEELYIQILEVDQTWPAQGMPIHFEVLAPEIAIPLSIKQMNVYICNPHAKYRNHLWLSFILN